jgi:hypothetical protein
MIGGTLLGVSLPVTQYLSLMALDTRASIHLHVEWCVAAVVISVVCSATAFWVMFRCESRGSKLVKGFLAHMTVVWEIPSLVAPTETRSHTVAMHSGSCQVPTVEVPARVAARRLHSGIRVREGCISWP